MNMLKILLDKQVQWVADDQLWIAHDNDFLALPKCPDTRGMLDDGVQEMILKAGL